MTLLKIHLPYYDFEVRLVVDKCHGKLFHGELSFTLSRSYVFNNQFLRFYIPIENFFYDFFYL